MVNEDKYEAGKNMIKLLLEDPEERKFIQDTLRDLTGFNIQLKIFKILESEIKGLKTTMEKTNRNIQILSGNIRDTLEILDTVADGMKSLEQPGESITQLTESVPTKTN
jgi:hypothetical protein